MELVAPAGNFDKLLYAYTYGADAAYIGLKHFSLRVKADNFYADEYKKIVDLKSQFPGKKLFCALNISFHNQDIDQFLADLDYFRAYPIDSFIIQDIGMVPVIQKYFPYADLHLSTQANCINREAVKMYQKLGFKRVVLGREASLGEIREIKDSVPEMELEVFAHGAMCIAYSGRCLMSAYLTGRSANSGFCSHSCRWEYKVLTDLPRSGKLVLEEKERPGEYYPIFEGDDYTAVLSSKDLCMINHLDDMQKAGVDALKIEGRMKSIYYVALITRAYRKGIDVQSGLITQQEAQPFIDELFKTSHREFTTGFFYRREDADTTTNGATDSPWELCAAIGDELPHNTQQDLSVTEKDGKSYPESEEQLFTWAKITEATRQQELEAMHPSARHARLADYAAHPEKCPPVIQKKDGWKFFIYDAMNKIDCTSPGQTNTSIPIEFIAPDKAFITADNSDYLLINPDTGEIMNWVCHGHPCLIYTSLPLEKGMLVRTINPRYGEEKYR